MQQVSGAAGAASLAASRTHFQSLEEAARAMTQTSRKIHPAPELAAFYDQQYQLFIALLNEKGTYTRKEIMLNVYLLRHGQTVWNAAGHKYCGRTDVSLTQLGISPAERAFELLRDINFQHDYATPL